MIPGTLVEVETRSKTEPMEKRPVKGPYGDFLQYGRRNKGNGRRGKCGKYPGGKGCPPYLSAGREYRPVYSATKDAWELVLGNMPKEERVESTDEKIQIAKKKV